jgi:hypothetical protein
VINKLSVLREKCPVLIGLPGLNFDHVIIFDFIPPDICCILKIALERSVNFDVDIQERSDGVLSREGTSLYLITLVRWIH